MKYQQDIEHRRENPIQLLIHSVTRRFLPWKIFLAGDFKQDPIDEIISATTTL